MIVKLGEVLGELADTQLVGDGHAVLEARFDGHELWRRLLFRCREFHQHLGARLSCSVLSMCPDVLSNSDTRIGDAHTDAARISLELLERGKLYRAVDRNRRRPRNCEDLLFRLTECVD
eukprot:CAMPEP_0183354624 /NCGR_PEP_ID=MMETSP0164_2-20130417/37593_1 /TAXON_ID=221442 /ORGANISM="Coccolithus pelagicus ssp braarudi, Strain PLY182g" /LENGTH=118 /DNA_ID=CAMNT_0025527545 /DNA_START=300 /DNA_END=656 /DNA_ORIENTATION=-